MEGTPFKELQTGKKYTITRISGEKFTGTFNRLEYPSGNAVAYFDNVKDQEGNDRGTLPFNAAVCTFTPLAEGRRKQGGGRRRRTRRRRSISRRRRI